MDNRKRALAILTQAREILGNRLIENIVESGDSILEDAEGSSYMDEIDSLHEKVGGRLSSINSMIANFPNAESTDGYPPAAADEAPTVSMVNTPPSKPANFAVFGRQIAANDIESAGQTLSTLFNVEPKLALTCATSFRDRLNDDPTIIQTAMRLQSTLIDEKNNDTLMILWNCFGLEGLQAVSVMKTLKMRM